MKKKINNIIDYIVQSFNGNKKGASAKKLTAFVFVILTCYIEVENTDANNVYLVVGGNIAFISVLFGIATYEKDKGHNEESNPPV